MSDDEKRMLEVSSHDIAVIHLALCLFMKGMRQEPGFHPHNKCLFPHVGFGETVATFYEIGMLANRVEDASK